MDQTFYRKYDTWARKHKKIVINYVRNKMLELLYVIKNNCFVLIYLLNTRADIIIIT